MVFRGHQMAANATRTNRHFLSNPARVTAILQKMGSCIFDTSVRTIYVNVSSLYLHSGYHKPPPEDIRRIFLLIGGLPQIITNFYC